ncbi:YqiJ family protein [Aestuariispira insulae]|uniref:Uncharacterized protein DUF1449 n=1 Tax=Aestuariispira insulae TaxID=1461337 RepID=A0A3D9HX14_9PROT|nr:YqiJ family protein [Aestuariispira insulae]RED53959.1 uncharacterized protein DUF1449 [Aestuariispira insulae]
MFAFFLSPENMPFTISLGVMLAIAVLEGTMTLLGAGLSDVIDSLIPDLDGGPDIELDLDADAAEGLDGVGPSALSQFLGWLCFGRVPALIWLVGFLTVFGLTGLMMQRLLAGFGLGLLPAWIAWAPALAISLPPTRLMGLGLSKLVPNDESSAVSSVSFIGRTATVTLGVARSGKPAQARLTDQHGQTHYVMLEPDMDGDAFPAGTDVILVRKAGGLFRAIKNDRPSLAD